MSRADIKLGYSCNNNCIHCVISDQRELALEKTGSQDKTTEEYKKELKDSFKNGCSRVIFTGGEPTIRRDLVELLDFAFSLGYDINMQTNGRMFFYEDFVKKLCKFNISYRVALNGHTKEVHDSITRSGGSFKQTVEGIKNLVKNKQIVFGKVVISKKNYRHLVEIAELFIKLDVVGMNFAFPHAQGNAWKYFDQVIPRYKEIEKSVHDTIDFVEKYNKEQKKCVIVNFEAIPFCFMKGYEKYIYEIKFIGKEYSELKQLDGRILNWEQERRDIKKKFKKCDDCKYDFICEGVWEEYPKKMGDEEFIPVK